MTVRLRPVREITAEEENFRTVPFFKAPGIDAHTSRRDPVEPESVGTIILMAFRVTGYDPDCDGSLMARLEAIDKDGEPGGWEPNCIGLYPHSELVVEGNLSELWDPALLTAAEKADRLRAERDEARREERERCAKLCEDYSGDYYDEQAGPRFAASIRALPDADEENQP